MNFMPVRLQKQKTARQRHSAEPTVYEARDARYWSDRLSEVYPGSCLPAVHLRTAISEAAAQSLPVHVLGARPGAAEAAAEFDVLLARILGEDGGMIRSVGDGGW